MADFEKLYHMDDEPEKKDTTLHPSDPNEINPKVASDIAYWSGQFGVSGPILHEAIRMHGTSVEKIRKHLETKHDVNLT